MVVGCIMRRRRARAFKTAYPLQQVHGQHNQAEQGAAGYYGQQWNPQQQGMAAQPQYGQQYVPSQGAPASEAPPQCASSSSPPSRPASSGRPEADPLSSPLADSNYRQDSGSHYAPPSVPPPMSSHPSSTGNFAPPSSPPPAANTSTYAPPSGPPPTHGEDGKALTGEEREAWQAAQEARERDFSSGGGGGAK